MSKIKIKYNLKNSNQNLNNNCLGILNNNKIIYSDNGITTTIDKEKLIITRKNDDYEINLHILEEKGYIDIKEGRIELELKIITKTLEDNRINIEYLLNNEKYIYEVEYEAI